MIRSNIKKIMENKEITLRELMAKTGLSNETVLRARGEKITKCRLETLQVIANALGCSLKALFDEVS